MRSSHCPTSSSWAAALTPAWKSVHHKRQKTIVQRQVIWHWRFQSYTTQPPILQRLSHNSFFFFLMISRGEEERTGCSLLPPEHLFCDLWICVFQAVWNYFCLQKKKNSTWILTLLMHLSLLSVASTPFNLLLDFWFWQHRQRWMNSLIPSLLLPSSYTLTSRKESKKLS